MSHSQTTERTREVQLQSIDHFPQRVDIQSDEWRPFDQIQTMNTSPEMLKKCLPTKDLAMKMLDSYLECVHPFHPVIDTRELKSIFNTWYTFHEGTYGQIGIIFAVCCHAALVQLKGSAVKVEVSCTLDWPLLYRTFHACAEQCLVLTRYMHSPTMFALQIFLILLSTTRKSEKSGCTWFIVGTVFRLAQILGLQKISDAEESIVQLKRRIWTIVANYDLQTAIAILYTPMIRFEDPETPCPRNVDSAGCTTNTVTESTFTILLHSLNNIFRSIPHIGDQKMTYIETLFSPVRLYLDRLEPSLHRNFLMNVLENMKCRSCLFYARFNPEVSHYDTEIVRYCRSATRTFAATATIPENRKFFWLYSQHETIREFWYLSRFLDRLEPDERTKLRADFRTTLLLCFKASSYQSLWSQLESSYNVKEEATDVQDSESLQIPKDLDWDALLGMWL